VTFPHRPSAGPIEAELVGGPHDGRRLAIPYPRPHLDTFQQGYEPTARYQLDPRCVDNAGQLVTAVARYLFQPLAVA
jgi:hypothetical protein